ncbi:MAG: aspartate/glutamate racemase family protein [Devosia sp.]|nr:aspartate/glutamate racemase family protein [Devosia sp.]
MRILLLNPNMTEAVTELMADAGRSVAAAGTEIVAVTAGRGVPYISTRAEAQIGGTIALEMLAEHDGQVDAAIIAAFGDPGLLGARELFDFPVIGVSEAAMLTACMLGQRFAVVTFSKSLVGWYRDCVELNGLAGRCAGIHALDLSFADVASDQDGNSDLLVELAGKVVRDSDADSLIFGGAPLAGLAHRSRDRIPVPIIDPVAAAVKQAEALIALRPRKAITGSFQRPGPKATAGIALALAARIEHCEPRL